MELIPAVDLLAGGAVRLEQGDYEREALREADAPALAARFAAAGVARLHLVDLEGARAGEPRQLPLLRRVTAAARAANPSLRIEAGGGLRSVEAVEAALAAGVDDAVLGTAALERPAFVGECAARWPGRILVSLDLRDGHPALDGWLRTNGDDPLLLARRLVEAGAAALIVTDARRDGTLGGPNLELLARFRAALPGTRLVAAGGVGSLEHLRELAGVGVDGAIVGLALLAGTIDLDEALAVAGGATQRAATS